MATRTSARSPIQELTLMPSPLSETKALPIHSLPIGDCRLPISVADDSRKSAIFTVVCVSLAVIVPAMFWGIPSNLDLTNHFRFVLPFYDAIAGGNLYPG